MSNLIKLEPETIQQMDEAIDIAGSVETISSHSLRALNKANARIQLEEVFNHPEIKKLLVNLQNSEIGFLTDESQNGYHYDIIKRCATDALLHGVNIDGNEFCIIKGRCYLAKNGMTHKLNNLIKCGILQSYVCTPLIPEFKGKDAISKVRIEWMEGDGKTKAKNLEFMVKSYGNNDADYVNGKGERRAKKWLFETLTGRSVPDGETTDAINVTSPGSDETIPRKSNLEKSMEQKPAIDIPAYIADSEISMQEYDSYVIEHQMIPKGKDDLDYIIQAVLEERGK